jgi:hypothetical protein
MIPYQPMQFKQPSSIKRRSQKIEYKPIKVPVKYNFPKIKIEWLTYICNLIGVIILLSLIIGLSVGLYKQDDVIIVSIQPTSSTSTPLISSSSSSPLISSSTGSISLPLSEVLPSIQQMWSQAPVFPTPLGQDDLKRGSGSKCWHLEWLTQFAAYLQPPLVGTPRMNGNWSSIASIEMLTFQTVNNMYNTCDSNPLIYTPGMFDPNRPVMKLQHDIIGGTQAIQIYVDINNGLDTNTGTITNPYQTINKALLQYRLRQNNSIIYSIIIRHGTYVITTPILFYQSDINLIIMGQPNEDIVFTGAVGWNPTWTSISNSIYTSPIPSNINIGWDYFNEFWAENGHQIRARYPNGNQSTSSMNGPIGWVNVGGFVGNTNQSGGITTILNNVRPTYHYSEFTMLYGGPVSRFSPPNNFWGASDTGPWGVWHIPLAIQYPAGFSPRVSSWTNIQDTYVHVAQCKWWGSWHWRMSSVNISNQNILLGEGGFQEGRGCSDGDCQTVCDQNPMFIDHQLAELDMPGEYYVDRTNKILYYYPVNPQPPNIVYSSQTPTLIIINGGTNITFSGITFTRTSNTFMTPHSATGGGDWSNSHNATIQITNCQNCTLINCLITDVGGNGIGINDQSNGTYIAFNEISHTGANGIAVMGSINGYDASIEQLQPRYTYIQSNLIYDVGLIVKQSGAVHNTLAYQTSIIGNLFAHTPRSAVNFQDGFGGGHVLSYNLILGAARETQDVGPVNFWNRLPYYSFNTDTQSWSWFTSTSWAHHNLILGDNYTPLDDAASFDCDDGTSNWIFYDNILTNSRLKTSTSIEQEYYNNLIIPPPGLNCIWITTGYIPSMIYQNNTCFLSGWSDNTNTQAITGYAGTGSGTLALMTSITSTAYNTYITPLYSSTVYADLGSVDYTIQQWQALPYPGKVDIGSTLQSSPMFYPYYRFWGPTILGYNISLASIYSNIQSYQTSIYASVAVSNTYTDTSGNIWRPLVCRDACVTYDLGSTGSSNPSYLYSAMHYSAQNAAFSYSFPLQNGIYNLTLTTCDLPGDTNTRYIGVTVNGVLLLTNGLVNPPPRFTVLNWIFPLISVTNNYMVIIINGTKNSMNMLSIIPN